MRLLLVWNSFDCHPEQPGCTFDGDNLGKAQQKAQPISGKRFYFFAISRKETLKCSLL